MQHMITPYSRGVEPYVWKDDVFSPEELDRLQAMARGAEVDAQVGAGSGGAVVKEIRRSQVSWLSKSQDTAWVFEKLAHAGAQLNARFYGFDLTGFGEALQMTNYDSSEHGMYGWHQDFNAQVSRKLSLVVQLSDPSEYEGGNLEILTGNNPMRVRKQRGLLAAFPAWTVHQVTPVSQGTRQTLVAWISGPDFK